MPEPKIFTGRYLRMGGTFGCTIPANARKVLGWQEGGFTVMQIIGDLICIRKVTKEMVLSQQTPKRIAPPELGDGDKSNA
jgi:bifunctional DNA-binding transcriptional regulator/antitoxin component of YhaV-PrlF toxin-antitoxin module